MTAGAMLGFHRVGRDQRLGGSLVKHLVIAVLLTLLGAGAAEARIDCQVGSTAMMARLLHIGCGARAPQNGVDPSELRASLILPPAEIRRIVEKLAPLNGLETRLVMAVIAAESAFDTHAISPRNARGLMQLMPDTAARFGVRDPFDAEDNIRGGTTYLQWLIKQFDGNLDLVLAAYNAGEGAVQAYGTVPPYGETIQYIGRVKRFYGLYAPHP